MVHRLEIETKDAWNGGWIGHYFFFTLLYCYWNCRNSFIFGKLEKMEQLVMTFNLLVRELAEVQGKDFIQDRLGSMEGEKTQG